MLRYFCTSIFISCFVFFGTSQSDSLQRTKVVQLSGLVVTGDSLTPLPLSTVYRKRDMRGTVCDVVGFFSIPAFAGDTVVFSSIGYLSTSYILPDSISENRLSLVQFLRSDTVLIDTAEILPWPNPSQFKQEFLAMESEMNEYQLTRKNLNDIVMYDRMIVLGADGRENFRLAMQQQAEKMYYNGQANPISLLNPLAWASFIQSWRNGSFRRQ